MHPLLPHDDKDWHISYINESAYSGGKKVIETNKYKHRGPVRAYKLRRFCRTCNAEWMSKIEDQAKVPLEDLMCSKSMTLDKEKIEAVATWFALKTMVFEYAGHPDSVTVPKTDYDYIRKNGLPPLHWRIWIGSHDVSDWVMREGVRIFV